MSSPQSTATEYTFALTMKTNQCKPMRSAAIMRSKTGTKRAPLCQPFYAAAMTRRRLSDEKVRFVCVCNKKTGLGLRSLSSFLAIFGKFKTGSASNNVSAVRIDAAHITFSGPTFLALKQGVQKFSFTSRH